MKRITNAFKSGIKRVSTAPAVLVGTWALTLLAALPLALTLRQMIIESLGASAVARDISAGWFDQFAEHAVGVGRAFSLSTFGFAAILDNLSSIFDNRAHALPIAAAACAYAFVWIFLIGGVIDRYGRMRATRARGFFSACGAHFFRLLRLAIVAGLAYFVLFAYAHPLLFGTWQSVTFDSTSESNAFALRIGCYALFGALLGGCSLIFDYARVRLVVEDRRSALAAIAATVAFVRRRPAVIGLFLLDGCLYLAVVALYALVAPGVSAPAWSALLVGQLYVMARLWVKLVFSATEIAFFQGVLAHAEYIATPCPSLPESPAAEAIIGS